MGVKALALALHTPCYGREGKGEGGHFLLMIFNLFPVVSCTKKMLCEQHGQLYILLVNIKIKKSLNRTRCVCVWCWCLCWWGLGERGTYIFCP